MTTVQVHADRILVRAPFAMTAQLRAIAGARWSPSERAWTYPPASALALARIVPDPALLSMASPVESDSINGLRTKLWRHQENALRFALARQASMLALAMGCGKSAVTIAYALATDCRRILIACPLSVVGVWPREFERHSSAPWTVTRLDGGTVAEKAATAGVALRQPGRHVVVVNHESLWREPFNEFAIGAGFDLLVVDESHRSKAPGGKLSRYLTTLARRIPRRLALTGTPLPHSPLDAYAQFRFLDTEPYGTSFVRFKGRYCILKQRPLKDGRSYQQIVGWQNMAEFEQRFGSIAIRVRKEDALDLPAEMDVERRCVLEPRAAKLYRDLADDFVAQVERGIITASNALVQLLRLQQLTSGTLKTDEGETEQVSTAKERLFADVLEDVETPVVVFARFSADIDAIRRVAEAAGKRCGELSGRRRDLTADATMPDDIDVLAVQIQSGGVGIDLTRAATAIYYSHGLSLGDLLQSRARLHRPGQMRPVTYIHLIVNRSIDEQIMKALAAREELVEAVLKNVGRA